MAQSKTISVAFFFSFLFFFLSFLLINMGFPRYLSYNDIKVKLKILFNFFNLNKKYFHHNYSIHLKGKENAVFYPFFVF